MNIVLNGAGRSVSASALSDILAEAGFADAAIATAVNGAFVPAAARPQTVLKEGDRLEVLAPMQGG